MTELVKGHKDLWKKGPGSNLKPSFLHFLLGIVITNNGMEIEESFEKAFLDTNARRMLPTLCGISLDMQFRSAVAVRVIAAAKMTVAPSLLSFWNFQKITGTVEIKPK